ncbi:zinc finger protein, putative, partial [Ixodes scapularis]
MWSCVCSSFFFQIEESVALVPGMVAEEKLKAVQFWNVVSERLQEIVNDSAADINALALKMQKDGMATQYSVGETTAAPSHEQEYLELPVELESVAPSQPVPVQGSFHSVPLGPQRLDGMSGTEPSADSDGALLMPMCNARPQECFELPQQDQNPSGLIPGSGIGPEILPPSVKVDFPHMWTHRKPFSCTECDARFSTKSNLVGDDSRILSVDQRWAMISHINGIQRASHLTKDPLVPFSRCQICQRRFAQNGILQTHMAMHLGQKSHLCEHCGKAFRQRSQLRLHTFRHQGVRKYDCATCPSKFLTKVFSVSVCCVSGEPPSCLLVQHHNRLHSLNEHTNRHYGIKPYECKRCGKTFAEMS